MSERHSFVSATLAELNRRKVLRTVGAYAVGVFVLLQLMDAAVEPLRLPDWLPTLVVIVVILGFPLVFVLAWHLEVHPDGIHRTVGGGLLTRSQSALLFSLMLLYQYYSGVFEPDGDEQAVAQRDFSAPENSIAVLPFTDLSQDGNQAYIADGISEEILNLLTQVQGLRVAARTSSFAFRNSLDDIRKIGRLLNVRTILEGSVRTSGDRIRLTAQLINVEDGYHIWSNNYDREATDVFAIQDEVASSIAGALVESFDGLESKPAARTDSLAASQAYRTGRLHWWRRTPGELQKAIEMFATALENDAHFAPAYAAMADSWLLLSLYGNVTTVKATEKAQDMIDKALAIDPESAEAFAALGLARWQIGQMDAAESALRHAVELNEDYIPAQLWLAGVLGELGRYPEEHLVLQNAMARDPLNELLMVNYAANLSMRGDWQAGRTLVNNLLELRPDSSLLLRSMARLELFNGNLVEGWKLANRAWQLEPGNPEDVSQLARIWVTLGNDEKAEQLLQEALESSGDNAALVSAYWMALTVAGRYEDAQALVREQFDKFGDELPESQRLDFNFELGLVALIQGDYASARQLLTAAIREDDEPTYNEDEITVITLAALAAELVGDHEQARSLLDQAERKVRRGRLNGVDDANVYYFEAVLLTMRNEPDKGLEKLKEAYDHGFRELWVLDIDGRLDPLREQPGFTQLLDRIRDDVNNARIEIESLAMAGL
jgi:TolB-like protein/Flp pilus assembly protein TadD